MNSGIFTLSKRAQNSQGALWREILQQKVHTATKNCKWNNMFPPLFYKWISFKFSLHNWLAHRRNFVQSARIRSSAHACSSCNALRPSTINLAAFPKTRPFLWSILRDHGQFSRPNPSPLVAVSGFSVYPRYVTFALVVVDFSHHLKHITRWGKEYAVRICY